jgi:hypothetical protein
MLVLQIVIKQWDKSKRSEADVMQRAAIPDKYSVLFPPALYVFNKRCVIDQHGDDRQGGRLKYEQSCDGKIKFDRFLLDMEKQTLEYNGLSKSEQLSGVVELLDNQWLQFKYMDRYSVFEGGFYYWLYEEVTLNAVFLREFNQQAFLTTAPAQNFEAIG